MIPFEIIQITTACLGSLGFGCLFNIRGKRLAAAGVGGFLAWTLCLILGLFIESEPLNYFIVSACISLYAEIMARVLKTPASPISITSLIPLVPGSSLYYTMASAFQGQSGEFVVKAVSTLKLSASLALGIILVSALARLKIQKVGRTAS